jgi:ribose 5-phosphate isomerase B
MKVAIGSDHAGYQYKERIKEFLSNAGYDMVDFGTDSDKSCDYPDFVEPAARAVAVGECQRAIVLGGSGNGEAIVANKVKGVRCSLCWDLRSARLAREHNNANVLSLGQRMMAIEEALEICVLWLNTDFEGDRHQKRLDKISEIEEKWSS